jgi:hypothetical protein
MLARAGYGSGVAPVRFLVIAILVALGFALVWWLGVRRIQAGVRSLRRSAQLRAEGLDATGVVVGNLRVRHERTDDDGRDHVWYTFHPQLRFQTRDGREITATAPRQIGRPVAAGTVLPVRYHPERPQQVEITSGPGRGGPGWSQIRWGVAVTVILLVFLVLFLAI